MLLNKWTDDDWSQLPRFLTYGHSHFGIGIDSCGQMFYMGHDLSRVKLIESSEPPVDVRLANRTWRQQAIHIWLEWSEVHPEFAKKLDRTLGLYTDDEIREVGAWWGTFRNKWMAPISIVVSIISLIVSVLAFMKSSK